jgi:hypothetical protein
MANRHNPLQSRPNQNCLISMLGSTSR